MINVKDAPYNALGDGLTDDTAAIAAAIQDAGKDEEVHIPAGTYLTDQQLANGRTVTGIHGWRNHEGGTILKAKPGFVGDAVIRVQSNAANITDIAIDAAGAPHGLWASSSHGPLSLFENISIRNAVVSNFKFEHCQIMRAVRLDSGYSAVGFDISAANGSVYVHCNSHHNSSHGFDISRGSSSGVITLDHCLSQVNSGDGIRAWGNGDGNGEYLEQVEIISPWIEGNDGDGISLKWALNSDIIRARLLPGDNSSADRCIRLEVCRMTSVSRAMAAQGAQADWIKIANIGGLANDFVSCHRLSNIKTNTLVVESKHTKCG